MRIWIAAIAILMTLISIQIAVLVTSFSLIWGNGLSPDGRAMLIFLTIFNMLMLANYLFQRRRKPKSAL